MTKTLFAHKYVSVRTVTKQDRMQDGLPAPEAIQRFKDYVTLIESLARDRKPGPLNISDEAKESQPVVRFLHNEMATAFIVDYDNISRATFKRLHESILPGTKLRCFLHTTSKHTKDAPRCRIIFPLAAPVPRNVIDRRIYEQVIKSLELPDSFDTKTCSANRNWFVPTFSASGIKTFRFNGNRLSLSDINVQTKNNHVRLVGCNAENIKVKGLSLKTRRGKNRHEDNLGIVQKALCGILDDAQMDMMNHGRAEIKYDGKNIRIRSSALSKSWPALQLYCDCPRCNGIGKLSVVVGLGSKVMSAKCYKARCSAVLDKTKFNLNAAFDCMKVDAEQLFKAVRANATTFNLKNVTKQWWIIDGSYPIASDEVARCITTLSDSNIKDVLRKFSGKADHILDWGISLPYYSDDEFERSMLEFQNMNPMKLAKNDRLVIAKGDYDELTTRMHAPICGTGLDRSNWKLPTINIQGFNVSYKKRRNNNPLCIEQLEMLGYRMLSRKTLRKRLLRLPPVIFVKPPQKASPGDCVLFRQRIFLALQRGCLVCVIIDGKKDTVRSVAKNFGISKGKELGLKFILNEIKDVPEKLELENVRMKRVMRQVLNTDDSKRNLHCSQHKLRSKSPAV